MTKEIILPSKHITLIDDEDYDRVSRLRWHVFKSTRTMYVRHVFCTCVARVATNVHPVFLHRFILNPPDNMVVDHLDHNGLNNQKANLRICAHKENLRNCSKRSLECSSKYLGVSWESTFNFWEMGVTLPGNKKVKYRFDSEQDAGLSRDFICLQHYDLMEIQLNFPSATGKERLEAFERRRQHSNKFGFYGVSKNKRYFRAMLLSNGIIYSKQGFSFPEDAAREYDRFVIKHGGARHKLNFPKEAPGHEQKEIE